MLEAIFAIFFALFIYDQAVSDPINDAKTKVEIQHDATKDKK